MRRHSELHGSFPGVSSPFSDSTATPGTYCYRVTGHGYAGGDAGSSAQVTFETTPPSQPVFVPPLAATVSTPTTLAASSSDPGGSGMSSLTIRVNGSVLATGVSSASVQWNAPDGTYTVSATAIDAAGNQSVTSQVVAVDNSGPVAPAVTAPSPVAGKPTLFWPTVAGDTYAVSRNGVSLGTVSQPWTDPAEPVPGTYRYVVTAIDPVGNTTQSAEVVVVVVPPSVTAPRSISAKSPTNSIPRLTWQPPVTFAVLGWRIYRDGAVLTTLSDPAASAFDDATLTDQGPHSYAVQALGGGGSAGDISSPVSVTYDTRAPALGAPTASANPSGSISVDWPAADDPAPGSGIGSYVVRRGTAAPSDPAAGVAVCTLVPPATGCVDETVKSGTAYGYGVFAIDAAGNVSHRAVTARAVDTQPPDPVAGLRVVSFDRTYARLGWTIRSKAEIGDLAGYRVLLLRPGAKAPLNPLDGKIVCRAIDPGYAKCDALNLTPGKRVTFAVYAFDEVPNYSKPVIISMIPHKTDKKPPHKPTKVRLTREGLRYTLKWVSPRDVDLSKFRVTLYDKGPAPRPSKGKAVVTGRVLHANFTLQAGKKVYVTLFALDVSGNFSKVSRYVVAPGKGAKSKKPKKGAPVKKKAVVPKKAAEKKPVKAPVVKKKPKKPAPEKSVPVTISS